ncbi:MAG: GDSL-type esterase/lipase family protein [Candidatus Bathyarchaeia archaeon]
MNLKIKLLTLGIIVLVVLLSVETYAWQTGGNSSQTDFIRVACVGDSITCGTAYPDDLWLMLGSKYVVGNFGINGATVFLNSSNPYMNTPALKAAKQFDPKIVIIMLGTNDADATLNESKAVFVADYIRLISQLQGLSSKPKVWIANPPPIFNNSAGLSGQILVDNIIPGIAQVASDTGVPVIDVYSVMVNHSADFLDGVHPDINGSMLVATAVYNAVGLQG